MKRIFFTAFCFLLITVLSHSADYSSDKKVNELDNQSGTTAYLLGADGVDTDKVVKIPIASGVDTALGVNVGLAGAIVTNGGALGTPSSGTLSGCYGLPASGVGSTTTLNETTAANDSGGYIVGLYDEFDNSSNTNVQGVVKDLDTTITKATVYTTGYTTDADPYTIAKTANKKVEVIEITPHTSSVSLQMSETNAVDGDRVVLVNVGATACDMADITGQQELTSTKTIAQYETVVLAYATDRWVEEGGKQTSEAFSSIELGGGTLEIPNGTSDVALANGGEIHLNTTDEQLSVHSAADGEISGEAALSLIQHKTWSFDPKAV